MALKQITPGMILVTKQFKCVFGEDIKRLEMDTIQP